MSNISGVVNDKWHSKKKITDQARQKLSRTSEESDFTQREAIFDKYRQELCSEIRYWLLRALYKTLYSFLYLDHAKLKLKE